MAGSTTTAGDERAGIPSAGDAVRIHAFPWRKVFDAGVIVAAAVGAAILLRAFVFEALHIPTRSMEPSLLSGDFVILDKLPFSSPAVGGVYAFRAPVPAGAGSGGTVFVKRCVAVPGDTVIVVDGRIWVNGKRIPTASQAGAAAGRGKNPGIRRAWVIPLPGAEVPLNDSTVSLWRTLIEREGHRVVTDPSGAILLDGIPATSYRIGQRHYFVAGDNSEDSYDSRYWGPVPESAILGMAILVYWSWDDARSAVRWGRVGTIVR